jgi:hypothetical protein
MTFAHFWSMVNEKYKMLWNVESDKYRYITVRDEGMKTVSP